MGRRVVQDSALFDDELAERINILTSEQINILVEKRGSWLGQSVHVGREYDKGEVLVDTRGRGTLQKAPVPLYLEKQLKAMQRLNEERRLAWIERSQTADSAESELEVYQLQWGGGSGRRCKDCQRRISLSSKSGLCRRCVIRRRARNQKSA